MHVMEEYTHALEPIQTAVVQVETSLLFMDVSQNTTGKSLYDKWVLMISTQEQ